MDDANDTTTDDAATDDSSTDDAKRAEITAALARVLDHAEGHGEVYAGATNDHRTLRELLESARGYRD